MEGVTMRPYREEDREALHELDFAFQREVGLGVPGKPLHRHDDIDQIADVYLNAGGAFWVLETSEREVIGCGGVLKVDVGTARLRRFRVAQEWRRRGLATRLLTEAERFCRDQGLLHVTLGTTDEQRAARALYRKHGYGEVGERWLAPDMREIEFAKDLD
jgi:GNAT superfamily N-acetyltransferase